MQECKSNGTKEDFKILTSYALELKHSNLGSSVNIVSIREGPFETPVFQKIYICLTSIKEGFLAGCRRLIGLDGCFLKGIMKGQLLVAVGKDGNNQMYPVAWPIVDKENSESWGWFLEQLKVDLGLDDGLSWAIISDM